MCFAACALTLPSCSYPTTACRAQFTSSGPSQPTSLTATTPVSGSMLETHTRAPSQFKTPGSTSGASRTRRRVCWAAAARRRRGSAGAAATLGYADMGSSQSSWSVGACVPKGRLVAQGLDDGQADCGEAVQAASRPGGCAPARSGHQHPVRTGNAQNWSPDGTSLRFSLSYVLSKAAQQLHGLSAALLLLSRAELGEGCANIITLHQVCASACLMPRSAVETNQAAQSKGIQLVLRS